MKSMPDAATLAGGSEDERWNFLPLYMDDLVPYMGKDSIGRLYVKKIKVRRFSHAMGIAHLG